MNEDQFRELMDCLNGIASRLDAIESAVSEINDKQGDYCAYSLEDVVNRLDAIESAASDINHKHGEYCAYNLEDVVKALWDVEKALGG